MFENQQETIDALILESEQFRRLYDKHAVLKTQVNQACEGDLAMDQFNLEQLKKQKLQIKDELAVLIKNYNAQHA
ncbi:MAG: YdcH family protein [Gammaproteobacteria bacterium]